MFDHYSVLEEEVIDGLAIKSDGTYVDCTVGGGGHAERIVSQLSEAGLLVAMDQDHEALDAARKKLQQHHDRTLFVQANFRQLEETFVTHQITKADGILFDLGVSSPQLDRGERGFSYQHDAKLDMRMNQAQHLDAHKIVNEWPYNQLVKVFFGYGEEKFSKQIAREIENARKNQSIDTTFQLVEIIKKAIPAPARRKGGHPAKRIFQALRITVNDELAAFNDALHQAARNIGINGRIAVITFHSLEDRICKQAFRKWTTAKPVPRNLPIIPDDHQAPFKLVNKKPIVPSEDELDENRRSRSAKLRIVEKTGEWHEDFTFEEGWKKS
ncbi:16S rRNA (cytosine1402-N4)-methyltransferase [Lentibacillus persicus]|uniref:Ribosomal RNA small subunit methyltransferase H n=1 Tax=Lentibacillus persicus TaxID=640948 RepID=A0A1I1VQ32_9BACI|nr:16S rRNA (cytosine(1402)-N(4))-methyltransferase RsmH [Lentibacillus persicus]SFD82630.1 16S rRNA (cytosine1402-N4)-methyltransferase [Lentibacillus persicus]